MNEIAIRVHQLGKSYRIAPVNIGKKWRKRRVLTEDLSRLVSRKNDQKDMFTFWALKDLTFEVSKGEVLGIMGPNGAGKSTLLKILSKITYPTQGQVDIWGRTGALLEVGTGFHSELTGRENIYLSGSIMGMSRQEIDQKFDEIVDFSGVEEFLDIPVKRFSSGMEMRLAFSVAAHLEADILFIDEVLAVGDAAFRQKCINKMEAITEEQGRTILFVSHQLSAIQELCDQAIVLEQGRLISPPTSVLNAVEIYHKIMAENVGHDLAARLDRQGLGKLKLVDFSVHDSDKGQINEVASGQPVELRLQFEQSDLSIRDISAEIELTQPDGQILVQLDSGSRRIEAVPGRSHSLSCFIQSLPITPGVVQINLKLDGDGVVQDKITHAAYLIITSASSSIDLSSASIPMIRIEHRWATSVE